jgi:hypothetical protein
VAQESNPSGNRLFVIIAIALIGLICIGLMGLGGVLYFIQSNRDQQLAAQATNTATPFPPTFTPTATATPTATDTPEPTPTPTLVVTTPAVEENGGQVSGQTDGETLATPTGGAAQPIEPSAATETAVAAAGQVSPSVTPETVPGSGGVLVGDSKDSVFLAGGIILAFLIFSGVIYWRKTGTHPAN